MKRLFCLLLALLIGTAACAEGVVSESEPTAGVEYEAEAEEAPAATDAPSDAPTADPTAEPGEPTQTPEGPESTPVPEGLVLTIRYVNAEGGTVAPDHVQYGLKEGDAYEVASPQVQGMMTEQMKVSGVMGAEDLVITVTYKAGGFPSGKPGGFPGGRPNMGGMEGMGGDMMMEQKPLVTPGEALTDIHTSGDYSMNRYGALLLTGNADAPLLTDEGAVPQISLMNGNEMMPYTAQAQEDVLVLTGEAGVWHIGGDALRQMADSGFAYVQLVCGEETAQMPVQEYASGYAWDRLQMQGLPSAQFVYAVNPVEQTAVLSVGTEEYAAEDVNLQLEYLQREAE